MFTFSTASTITVLPPGNWSVVGVWFACGWHVVGAWLAVWLACGWVQVACG